jgi:hypothetical protein
MVTATHAITATAERPNRTSTLEMPRAACGRERRPDVRGRGELGAVGPDGDGACDGNRACDDGASDSDMLGLLGQDEAGSAARVLGRAASSSTMDSIHDEERSNGRAHHGRRTMG